MLKKHSRVLIVVQQALSPQAISLAPLSQAGLELESLLPLPLSAVITSQVVCSTWSEEAQGSPLINRRHRLNTQRQVSSDIILLVTGTGVITGKGHHCNKETVLPRFHQQRGAAALR